MAIVTHMLTLQEDGIAGYLAFPERRTPGPALLVIHHSHDISGELMIEAYDWAEQGYVVFIPALFRLVGIEGPFVPGSGQAIQKKVSDPQFLQAIRKGWDFLVGRSDVDKTRIGVLAYCLGGRLGAHFVAATPDVRCFATYYPSIKEEPETDLRPVYAFKPLQKIGCPTFVVFGGKDRVVSNDMQLKIWKRLIDNEIPLEWHFYSDGKHGLAAPPSSGFQPGLARRIWPLTADFLARELAEPV